MGRQIIFNKKRDPRLVAVRRGGALHDADHRLLAIWAADCAQHILHLFEQDKPGDDRPRRAIERARSWARGEITMTQARTAAFAAHAAAREATGAAQEAARAAGHAAAVAHVAEHELGAAAYAIRAARAAAAEEEKEKAGRLECRWQRAQLPRDIRELVLDDQRLRNEKCWNLFDMKGKIMKLPEPQKQLDFPLMKALEWRRSVRKWKNLPLSEQELSNLLWAACGVTRKKYGQVKCKRTAPSACNSQEIRVYVITENGVSLYEEENHQLSKIISRDIRGEIGTQKMMKSAPMGLVFVADLSRMKSPFVRSKEAQRFCAWVDTGYVSQNVYLYCAAAGLGTVVLSLVDRDKLHKLMQLKEDEKIVLTQVVGRL